MSSHNNMVFPKTFSSPVTAPFKLPNADGNCFRIAICTEKVFIIKSVASFHNIAPVCTSYLRTHSKKISENYFESGKIKLTMPRSNEAMANVLPLNGPKIKRIRDLS